MTKDAEHFFMCLLAICTSTSAAKSLVGSLNHLQPFSWNILNVQAGLCGGRDHELFLTTGLEVHLSGQIFAHMPTEHWVWSPAPLRERKLAVVSCSSYSGWYCMWGEGHVALTLEAFFLCVLETTGFVACGMGGSHSLHRLPTLQFIPPREASIHDIHLNALECGGK
jgi:hypothetical protein